MHDKKKNKRNAGNYITSFYHRKLENKQKGENTKKKTPILMPLEKMQKTKTKKLIEKKINNYY